MKIGVIKEIDRLGRIVTPKEIRERYLIDGCVEIVMTEDGILIKSPNTIFVKAEENAKSES